MPAPPPEPGDADLERELRGRDLHPNLLAQLRAMQDWALRAKTQEIAEARRAELRARLGTLDPAGQDWADMEPVLELPWTESEPKPVAADPGPAGPEPASPAVSAPGPVRHGNRQGPPAPTAAPPPAPHQGSVTTREVPWPRSGHVSGRGLDLAAESRPAPAPPVKQPRPLAHRPTVRSVAAALVLLLAVGLGWELGSMTRRPAPPSPRPAISTAPSPPSPSPLRPAAPTRAAPAAVQQTATAHPGATISAGDSRPNSHQAAKSLPGAAAAGAARSPADASAVRRPAVSAPIPLRIPSFDFPEAAHGQGLVARIKVEVLVDEKGAVVKAVPLTRDLSGFGFERIALAAARKTLFQPATRDSVPVKMWTDLAFEFAE